MKVKHIIVIVDDDADDREIVQDAFSEGSEEQQFVAIENGERLLDYLKNSVDTDMPSLILLDLNMPGKDGRETLKEIKSDARYRSIPVIIFTTSSSHRDRIISYELGANCFITKPDTFNKLSEMAQSIKKLWLH
jgi:CheY-like chemotaxis protein